MHHLIPRLLLVWPSYIKLENNFYGFFCPFAPFSPESHNLTADICSYNCLWPLSVLLAGQTDSCPVTRGPLAAGKIIMKMIYQESTLKQ